MNVACVVGIISFPLTIMIWYHGNDKQLKLIKVDCKCLAYLSPCGKHLQLSICLSAFHVPNTANFLKT